MLGVDNGLLAAVVAADAAGVDAPAAVDDVEPLMGASGGRSNDDDEGALQSSTYRNLTSSGNWMEEGVRAVSLAASSCVSCSSATGTMFLETQSKAQRGHNTI